MKKSMGQQLFQAAVVLLGTLICGLGIQLELFSGAGVDPLTMFEEGLGRTTGVATGTIALGVNCVMLLLALLLNRKNIWVGTVITVFCLGPSINLFAGLMAGMGMLPPAGWLGKLAMNVAGVFLCGAGIAIYMLPDYGVGAMEAVMIFLAEKLHLPYGPVRIAMDCTWGVAGFFLGGTLGVGTIIGAFGIGISLDLCLRGLKKTLGKAIPAGK
ncbi:MAG: hypothetical protein HFF13_11890 [Angelakisella sp.]|jgi:uncharacterized membrane protein YczE|nr:hypothetical protein [Angelakisella sp.]